MFVLNTNEGNMKISNSFIEGSYPDFRQILLYPTFGKLNVNGFSAPTAFSVNGTVVNYICQNISEVNDINSVPECVIAGNSNTDIDVIIGLPNQLKGGEKIARNNVAMFHIVCNYGSGNGNGIWSFECTPGLLHSDGTITYGQSSGAKSGTDPVGNGRTHSFRRGGTPIEAVAGDYVIANIKAGISSLNANGTSVINFGSGIGSYLYRSISDGGGGVPRYGVGVCGPLPIQISIE